MVVSIVQAAAIVLVPLLILKRREKGLAKVFGTIAAAYFWGIVVAVAVWALNRFGVPLRLNADIGQVGSYVCIGLAIPFLMFGARLSDVRRLAKPVLLSFGALLLSVTAVATVVGRTIGAALPWGKQLCAMAVGMYTGGSPNFNAIGVLLGVDAGAIALGNLSDMLVGTVFYIFILAAAKPLLGRLLDRRARRTEEYIRAEGEAKDMDALDWAGFDRPLLRNLLLAFLCVALGAAAGALVWKAKGGALTDHLVPCVMLSGTVLGLALSFVKPVRETRSNGVAGHYLILVFSFALASSLDLTGVSGQFLHIAELLGLITVASFVLHALLCRLLRVDADCAIVTMTAGVYGPAFIPAVTRQLKNDRLTAPGLICGALGYAVGTLLGGGVFLLL